MNKNKVSEKTLQNIDETSADQDEELGFINYQEEVTHSKEERRNRAILIALSVALYLLGLGVFAIIVQTIYQMNEIAGIVVAIALLIAYTTCFIVIIVKIFSKHSFDLEFQKRKDGHYSEKNNNKVRWEIAKNIVDQSVVLNYLDKMDDKKVLTSKEAEKIASFRELQNLVSKYPGNKFPSSHKEDSINLAESLAISMRKDGVIYQKAKSLILKRSLSTGCLTALSQNTMVDASVVVVKNLQLIKDLIWLYGFRPTNAEMTKILEKIVKSVCLSVGLNTMQNGTNMAGKIFNKDSNNFLVQVLGQALNMGAQFIGNGAMTYMVGKYTINALLRQYRVQDIYRLKSLDDYEMEMNSSTIKDLNDDIKEEVKAIGTKPEESTDDYKIPELTEEKHKYKWYQFIQKHKDKKNKK